MADTKKVLIGKFEALPGTRDQINEIVAELIQQTEANEPDTQNLAFEFYEDPLQPNHYLFYERYSGGMALDQHIDAQYTKDFFAEFAPLLVGRGIVDANVRVYSVYSNPDVQAGIYQLQQDGVELLTRLFQNTPELEVSLGTTQGLIIPNNREGIPGIAINLLFQSPHNSSEPVEYGIFAVDDTEYRVNGILPDEPGYLEAVRQRSAMLFNTINAPGAGTASRNLPMETTTALALYQVQGGSI